MSTPIWLGVLLAAGCSGSDTALTDSAAASSERPWTAELPPSDTLTAPRQWRTLRTITHLHSPWSHDACDGEGLPDGAPDPECLAGLRAGLCALRIDAAYLTDHPSYAADQPFEALLHLRDEDEPVTSDGGQLIGAWMDCGGGEPVLLRPGIEDALLPLGLHEHAEDVDIYGEATAEAVAQEAAAGAQVFIAHTEGKELADLSSLQTAGLVGVEVFNIHAMFDPTIRQEDLGLEPLSWLSSVAPFTSPDGTAEPDFLFLGVLAEQTPSIASWDALQKNGRMVGIGGSDAHQNVWPSLLRDGERGDSYRRMLRWMSNHLLASERSSEAADEALSSGRLSVVFEVLGSPTGLDFHIVTDDGDLLEMGDRSARPDGTVHVACPALSADSPQGPDAPEINVTVFKDGVPWQDTCGEHALSGPGTYRARFDIVPWHLAPFLGEDPDPWLVSWPWIYTNPITITE
jgi:hypothetical protein